MGRVALMPHNRMEVINIETNTAIMIVMACLAFTTLILKVVEMSRKP
jgi:hypothetical protein